MIVFPVLFSRSRQPCNYFGLLAFLIEHYLMVIIDYLVVVSVVAERSQSEFSFLFVHLNLEVFDSFPFQLVDQYVAQSAIFMQLNNECFPQEIRQIS